MISDERLIWLAEYVCKMPTGKEGRAICTELLRAREELKARGKAHVDDLMYIDGLRSNLQDAMKNLSVCKEALEKVASHWFQPTRERGTVCGGCDGGQMPGFEEKHEDRCPYEIARAALEKLGEP